MSTEHERLIAALAAVDEAEHLSVVVSSIFRHQASTTDVIGSLLNLITVLSTTADASTAARYTNDIRDTADLIESTFLPHPHRAAN